MGNPEGRLGGEKKTNRGNTKLSGGEKPDKTRQTIEIKWTMGERRKMTSVNQTKSKKVGKLDGEAGIFFG